MRIAEVVSQIREILPNYTDLFADVLTISSITASGGVATIVTDSAHSLATGQATTIVGVEMRTPISAFSQSGLNFTFTTSASHDLTYGWPENSTIELGGFTSGDWNADFTLKAAESRNSFKVASGNSAPVLNGNEYLLEPSRIDGINGAYAVTVIDSTSFTVSGDFLDGTYTPVNGKVVSNPRVASVVDIDRALDEYTKQAINKFWLFVEPENASISKDRNSFSDANVALTTGTDLRSRIIDGFTAYIVAPTQNEIAAELAVDICRHDLLLPMMQTLYGFKFSSGLTNNTEFKTSLKEHGVASYDRAFLVYRYSFEVVSDLTCGDQVKDTQTRAFRNISYTQNVGGEDTINATVSAINLDSTT